jgi:hypothetical protein
MGEPHRLFSFSLERAGRFPDHSATPAS